MKTHRRERKGGNRGCESVLGWAAVRAVAWVAQSCPSAANCINCTNCETLGIAANSLSTTCCRYFPLGSADEGYLRRGRDEVTAHPGVVPTALGFGWYQLKKTPCSSKQLWGNKTSWKFLLAFMYSRSGLVLFIWFFHWAPAAMDGTEWSWDNLRTSLLTLLLNPLLRTFFSCLYFFFFPVFLQAECCGLRGRADGLDTTCPVEGDAEAGNRRFLPPPYQSQPALGRTLTLQCLLLTTSSHSSCNKNSISFGLTSLTWLFLIGIGRKLKKWW